MKFRFSNLIWGTFLLLAAVSIVFNQIDGFADIGIGSIIAAILSLAVMVQCIMHLRFAPLPIPLAVLYIVFQTPLELPYIKIWALVLASILASLGLAVLFPKKHRRNHCKDKHRSSSGNHRPQMQPENSSNENNPAVNVNFGSVSKRLHADNLETVQLNCNFGALKVFFDAVELAPTGAEVILNCSFGVIELFIPKHRRVIDKLNCTLGGVDIDKRFTNATENVPQITLTGNVSIGGIEVRWV